MRDRLNTLVVQGDRASVVLVEGMIHRGVRENRIQGEGKQGSGNVKAKEREMRIYLNRVHVVNWRAGYLESCQSGSGKGGWKNANEQSTGTKSAVSIALASPLEMGNAPSSYFIT